MKKLIGGGLLALAVGLALAAPANAMHYRGCLDALDAAGMIDHIVAAAQQHICNSPGQR